MLCTGLSRDGGKVLTIEHLMSAFAGLGIDNAYVDLSAPEVPIMDGSAGPFVFLSRPGGGREGGKIARFAPYQGFRVGFTVEFDHPAIPAAQSRAQVEFSTAAY